MLQFRCANDQVSSQTRTCVVLDVCVPAGKERKAVVRTVQSSPLLSHQLLSRTLFCTSRVSSIIRVSRSVSAGFASTCSASPSRTESRCPLPSRDTRCPVSLLFTELVCMSARAQRGMTHFHTCCPVRETR